MGTKLDNYIFVYVSLKFELDEAAGIPIPSGRLGSPPDLGWSVLLIFFAFCVVFIFFLIVSVQCLVCSMLQVSLDCPFLIAPLYLKCI